MISIDNFLRNITTNSLSVGENFYHMFNCKSCGYAGMLHRHGHYSRNVITLHQHLVIQIQRFLCPSCHKTYSRLPSCLIPYFIYSFDVIIFCLYSTFFLSQKIHKTCLILNELNPNCFISTESIKFFIKRYISCLDLTNSFFVNLEPFQYDMDLTAFTSDQAASIILCKIFKLDFASSFNFEFFTRMPKYFLSP